MKRILMAAAIAIGPVTAAASPLDIFSKIFVLGDSLSDGGNVFIATGGSQPNPDIFPGTQITNGDAWTTQLGLLPSLAGGTNYAFGGARARGDGDLPPNALAQVDLFLKSGGANDPDALATLWFGGNDVRDAFQVIDPAAVAGAAGNAQAVDAVVNAFFDEGSILDSALDAISDALDLLELTPLKNIAVVNLPNFARVPEVLTFAATLGPLEDTALAIATGVSREFNDRLWAELDELPKATSTFYVDIYGLFEEIAVDPGAFGFTNIDTPCIFALPPAPVSDCPGFLFYDPIHPTDAAHALVAARFTQTVAPVPLPAGGLLLLTGLGGLLVLRRRSSEK